MGDKAILVECTSLGQVLGLQAMLRERAFPGVVDIVPAAETVLIDCASPLSLPEIRRWLKTAQVSTQLPFSPTVHTLDTVYDGADLAEAARLAGMSTDALVTWHSGQDWVGAFGGFAPGFLYLTPSEHVRAIPRRDTPRTVVPAGSVALGGEYSAIYPGPSPGGWQLVGRTADTLWHPDAAHPALLQPGDAIRFNPVRDLVQVMPGAPPRMSIGGDFGLEILSPGAHTTVQDLGRPGFAHLGVTGSGAVDRAALRRVNRMVGNGPKGTGFAGTRQEGAAGLESVLAGLSVRAHGRQILAVTGGALELQIKTADGGRPAELDSPFMLDDGEQLTLRPRPEAAGFRSYVAVRGGVDLPAVLGSRATDMLSGLGPSPLQAGDFLPVLPTAGGIVGFPETPAANQAGVVELRFSPGPREEWFSKQSRLSFESQLWTVTAQSNRVGLRLAGTALDRAPSAPKELPSEGMVDGAIQVPPSGLPVLFLADHPVTGGYPVIGVVLAADLDKAAELAPGSAVRFRRF